MYSYSKRFNQAQTPQETSIIQYVLRLFRVNIHTCVIHALEESLEIKRLRIGFRTQSWVIYPNLWPSNWWMEQGTLFSRHMDLYHGGY